MITDDHEGWSQSRLLAHIDYLELRIEWLRDAIESRGYVLVGNREHPGDILEAATELIKSVMGT